MAEQENRGGAREGAGRPRRPGKTVAQKAVQKLLREARRVARKTSQPSPEGMLAELIYGDGWARDAAAHLRAKALSEFFSIVVPKQSEVAIEKREPPQAPGIYLPEEKPTSADPGNVVPLRKDGA